MSKLNSRFSHKITLTANELLLIQQQALDEYKNLDPKGLGSKEFIAKCFVDQVIRMFDKMDVPIEVDYPHEEQYISVNPEEY